MSSGRKANPITTEFYFDYRIEKISGDEEIKTPKLYFERDYHSSSLKYSLFAVPEEWLGKADLYNQVDQKTEAEKNKALAQLVYDSVTVTYDITGIDCASLTDSTTRTFKEAEIKNLPAVTFEGFWKNQCRLYIENNGSRDHSGVGVLEMKKNKNTVAKFFFAVNFTFRKKIDYYLVASGNKLQATFFCGDKPQNIRVKIAYNKSRMPCLKTDAGLNVLKEFYLDFSAKGKHEESIQLSAADENCYFYVTFAEEGLEKFYILNGVKNSTVAKINADADKKVNKEKRISFINDRCPFCHKPLNINAAKSKSYKGSAGVVCSSVYGDKRGLFPVITGKQSVARKMVFCGGDLDSNKSNAFDGGFTRLLPQDYLGHGRYKIAFLGSTRAGKTTYISRFFEITGDTPININMDMTKNCLKQFGVNVNTAPIALLRKNSGTNDYVIQDVNWTDTKDKYTERSINLNPPKYPGTTSKEDYTKYPFIAKVNNSSYVAFYDIAGEDAKHSKQIDNIANDERAGVFFLINGKKDIIGNNAVTQMLNESKLDKNCPVAVILAKMDMLEGEFDSNCHCLRSDYLDFTTRNYEGSEIENDINLASEEIRSYVEQNNLLPGLYKRFTNVKYFGVSSFNFKDSIHNDGDDDDRKGEVKFQCSAKRLELPFLWMIKQFGIIN